MLPPPQGYFKELFRVSKQQIIWGGNYFELPPCKGFIIWQKPGISEEVSFAMCEFAWTSFDITAKVVSVNREQDRIHPTQKPVDLYKWLLRRFAKPGDKILDTHLGSGSSRIAAHEMGYDFVGTEIDKRFFALQEERFKQACEQQSLFEVDGGNDFVRFEIKLSLWNKFKISEKRNNYKAVYHGFDFVMGCTTAAQICAETYGHGGTMHANKEGMEMAIEQ